MSRTASIGKASTKVKVLLDTHTFLWMAAEPEKLSARAREVCAGESLTLSVASIWEIGIKCQIGRVVLPAAAREYLARQIRVAGISVLPINYRHALAAAALPMRHEDPFDRMLAAQCLEEGLPCVTRDLVFAEYGVEAIW
jgi:PIN domain nuclease of toxin-antitoxin system